MTCNNGHDAPRIPVGDRMRCQECYREGNRRRSAARRDRRRTGSPYSYRCPNCSLVPCRCEEL